jgi:hypothetical protein
MRRKDLLGSWFQKFQSMVIGSIALDLWQHSTSGQESMVEEVFSSHSSCKPKRGRGGGQDPDIPFKGTLPMT